MEDKLIKELIEKIDRLEKKVSPIETKWLDNQEIMQLLHISKRTIQHYRDSGVISFSQIGNKIYYKLSDVQELLENNYKIKDASQGYKLYKRG